jgi:Fe(3+) dicitrate transport protein
MRMIRMLGGLAAGVSSMTTVAAWAQEPTKDIPQPPTDGTATNVNIRGFAFGATGGSAQALSQKQLERFKYDDPHQLLLQIPGVYVRGEDGFGLRPNIGIRGANSDRSKKITLMEDGVLFAPAPYSAPAAYFFPSIMRMRNVRVIKGPAAVVYGPQTVGGAMDLLTQEIPSARSALVDVALGNYGYNKAYGRAGLSDERMGMRYWVFPQ